MKYLVTFQDRITTAIVEAESASEAAVEGQKLNELMLVISTVEILDKKKKKK
jgi:hypothetical protein